MESIDDLLTESKISLKEEELVREHLMVCDVEQFTCDIADHMFLMKHELYDLDRYVIG